MAEHTPGPWKTVEDPTTLTLDIGILDYDPAEAEFRGLIAWLSQTNMIPVKEQKANACLIAAAPDLLKACAACTNIIGQNRGLRLCQGSEWVYLQKLLTAAIKKATAQ